MPFPPGAPPPVVVVDCVSCSLIITSRAIAWNTCVPSKLVAEYSCDCVLYDACGPLLWPVGMSTAVWTCATECSESMRCSEAYKRQTTSLIGPLRISMAALHCSRRLAISTYIVPPSAILGLKGDTGLST